ncbi:MAG: 5-oxoprolinase subunit PxpB [Chromatiales bacterium]|nr:5-oxoprolinase subunit PxpB [Chromatiales bacterium]
MRIEIAGENALIIYFADHTSPQISAQIQQTCHDLQVALGERLIDLIPSYASLLVLFDLDKSSYFEVRNTIQRVLLAQAEHPPAAGKLIELPVYYHPEVGPDLEHLAEQAKLSVPEVIKLHQAVEYRVYAIGFAPGFAYLGEVDERIAIARRATPRLKVPKGAVAIADRQTAVYPAESPGGWCLIGRCPTSMFNPAAEPSMPVDVGNRVRFKAIGREEYLSLGGELESTI